MKIIDEITKLEEVLDTLLLKEPKTLEDLDRIADLKLTIRELEKELYYSE